MSATSHNRRKGLLFMSSRKISRFLCGCFCPTVDTPIEKVFPQALQR